MDETIFKAYDVRGIYPDQMDEQIAYRIGRGFARVLSDLQGIPGGDLRVALGRDMRLSAPSMSDAYARDYDLNSCVPIIVKPTPSEPE